MLSSIRKHALDETPKVQAPAPKKPRKYNESDEQKKVVAWLRSRPNWLVMRMENALKRTHAQAARDKALGMEPGAPDLIVMFHTLTFYLEMKSRVGSVSDEQRKLHAQLRARGMPVAIGYGAEATIAALLKVEELWKQDHDVTHEFARGYDLHLFLDSEHKGFV